MVSSERFFYEKECLYVLLNAKHEVEDLLIKLRCSYSTRKQLRNIAKPIVHICS